MRLIVIVGTQLRHQYFLSRIGPEFDVAGIINYKRRLVPKVHLSGQCIQAKDAEKFENHLLNLRSKEKEYFQKTVAAYDPGEIPMLNVKGVDGINSEETLHWVKNLESDAIVDFGSGILRNSFLASAPEWLINFHGGLSPYFRGSSALFWPFYFQQPELAGVTYHLINNQIDGGPVLQHNRPKMYAGDTLHDIGCRAIQEATEAGIRLLRKLSRVGSLQTFPQKSPGKLFLERDFRPSHLKIVYDLMKNGLIENYLAHKEDFDRQYSFVDQLEDDK